MTPDPAAPPRLGLLEHVIRLSVQNRLFVIIGTLVFAGVGVYAFLTLRFDAFPDLTNIQVQVLTATPGLGTREVEQLVTAPVERVMGGLPGLREVRSLSRNGVSAVTVVFADGTDRWHARQLVRERLDAARQAIPEGAGTPEIAPPTTGLGEVYQLAITSDRHPLPTLYRIFERDIAPRLRTVDGVVEVNAWGGGAPQLEVRVDPFALAARRLPLGDVQRAIGQALGLAPGGAVRAGAEQTQVRAVAYPATTEALGELQVADGVRLADIADVVDGGALTVGLGTASGRGEALFVMVQLLADADARATVAGVRELLPTIEATLEDGITLVPVYDREKLVSATLATVARSLVEGGLLVIVVLFLLLGDLRAGLVVASIIPLSLLGAFLGLRVLGQSGNLMSLGAIDFGLVVDGTIVVVESLVALGALGPGRAAFTARVAERAQRVARPVFFAVAILGLVYVPILLLWGTEGKLFRPMALTVLFALGTALVLTFTFIPALSSLVIKPRGAHETWLLRLAARAYHPVLAAAVRRPIASAAFALAAVGGSVALALGLGVEFVPRLEEGDLVVQTRRLPSINPQTALAEATRVERAIGLTPEVLAVASRTGSPAVATDPMGLEEADVLVHLAPRDTWREGLTREHIVAELEANLARFAPGAELNFTQPIEMRFSELLEGITADVGIQIFGPDLDTLLTLGQAVATRLERIAGAADVVTPTLEGVPQLDVDVDAAALGRYGLLAEDVLGLVAGVQRGAIVGQVPRGGFLDDVVVRLALPPGVPLAELPIVLPRAAGQASAAPPVPLGELATLRELTAPAVVQRLEGSRRVIVTTNVRGRDVGGFVQEARAALADLELPKGYRLAWKGKFEQLAVATQRMLVLVPAVLFVIVGVLYLVFRAWRTVALVFVNIPVAVSGGLVALTLADLPLSMSAVVGCIALFGVAVMNGVVLLSRLGELTPELGAREAALVGARERFRPVLTTAAVAGIGFVPMALAHGVGAEVQRPLAIVVIGGLVTATLLTLVVLPSLYARVAR